MASELKCTVECSNEVSAALVKGGALTGLGEPGLNVSPSPYASFAMTGGEGRGEVSRTTEPSNDLSDALTCTTRTLSNFTCGDKIVGLDTNSD
jgi:hypothetical protein